MRLSFRSSTCCRATAGIKHDPAHERCARPTDMAQIDFSHHPVLNVLDPCVIAVLPRIQNPVPIRTPVLDPHEVMLERGYFDLQLSSGGESPGRRWL
jgi:hypothetical protein